MNFEIFIEFTVLFLLLVIVSYVMKVLKQPLIVGYIITGILAGPFVLNFVESTDSLSAFAQMGIAFLLFIVGLNLSPRSIKDIGKVSVVTGIGQIVFTTALGFAICLSLGFDLIAAIYISTAISFSSTIIIMKLLSDRKDLDTIYGRISIGFLIVQDLVAILILMFLSSPSSEAGPIYLAAEIIAKATGILLGLWLISWHILPRITRNVAESQELLLLFSVAWCFSVAAAFYQFGFSVEAGALFAGISLSFSGFQHEISAKVKPLRDFFIILFFIMLGSQLVFTDMSSNLPAIILLSVFILVGNPLVVMAILGYMGYKKRTGFMAGLTVAQISEFSLVLVALGTALGHLSREILSIVTTVGIITIAGSSYLIIYADKIYPVLSKYLAIFERKKTTENRFADQKPSDVILFGYNRIGFDIIKSIRKLKKRFLIVDYDPKVISELSMEGYDCIYGDANDYELLEELKIGKAKMVISTIPSPDINALIIKKVREENNNAIISVVAHQIDDAIFLYEQGATYVIMPHFLGGKHMSTIIEKNKLNVKQFIKQRVEALEYLKKRKGLGHEHPVHEKSR